MKRAPRENRMWSAYVDDYPVAGTTAYSRQAVKDKIEPDKWGGMREFQEAGYSIAQVLVTPLPRIRRGRKQRK